MICGNNFRLIQANNNKKTTKPKVNQNNNSFYSPLVFFLLAFTENITIPESFVNLKPDYSHTQQEEKFMTFFEKNNIL